MRNLLVLDKLEYQNRHQEFVDLMNNSLSGDNCVLYTTYEDNLIRKVRNFKFVGSFLQHAAYWIKSLKYAIKIHSGKFDNIYCINPIVGMFLGFLNKKAHLIVGGFLFEPKENKLYYKLRKGFTKLSLKGIDKVLVYGSKEVQYYENIFGLNKFQFIKYGIDFENIKAYENDLPECFWFSGGSSNRDYETLIKAYNEMPDEKLPLYIATQPWRLLDYDCSQITIMCDVVVENFGDVLKRAQCLILSLVDSDISAGHMVMFQAMSLGVPIIVNDIPAIRDYVSDDEVTFYKSGDVKSLIDVIRGSNLTVMQDKAKKACKNYEDNLTLGELIKRVMDC